MGCVCQPASKAALAEIERLHPNRDTASDGCCSSSQHYKQNPGSDHDSGMAFDIDHDPANGVDCNVLAIALMADPRVKYIIWNRRIWSRHKANQGWRPYTGSNPHDKHMHVSVNAGMGNDTSPWFDGAPGEDGLMSAEGDEIKRNQMNEAVVDKKRHEELMAQLDQVDRGFVWLMRDKGLSDAEIKKILGKKKLPEAA